MVYFSFFSEESNSNVIERHVECNKHSSHQRDKEKAIQGFKTISNAHNLW